MLSQIVPLNPLAVHDLTEHIRACGGDFPTPEAGQLEVLTFAATVPM